MEKPKKISIDSKTLLQFWLIPLGIVAAILLITKAASGLIILGAALFLALAISPLVNKIANIIPGEGKKLPIALSYLLVVGTLTAFVSIVVPTIFSETQRFVTNLPSIVSSENGNLDFINNIGSSFGISDLRGGISKALDAFAESFVQDFGTNFTNAIGAVGNIVTAVILILVISFLMIIEGPSIVEQFWSNFRTNPHSKQVQTITTRMANVVSKYVSNTLTVALIHSCADVIAIFILSLIFKFDSGLTIPLALITGVMSLIPMFGGVIGGFIVAILLAFNALPAGLIFLAYEIIYLQIESNFISPKVQGKGLQLPALVVLGSVTIGVYMFGLIGAIISIPIAGCIKVLLEELGDGFLPSKKAENKKATTKKLIAKKED